MEPRDRGTCKQYSNIMVYWKSIANRNLSRTIVSWYEHICGKIALVRRLSITKYFDATFFLTIFKFTTQQNKRMKLNFGIGMLVDYWIQADEIEK